MSTVNIEPVGILYRYSNHYFSALETLRKLMQSLEDERTGLVLPFTITCAATLESLLNDHIVSELWEEWTEDHYKQLSESYLTMSLRGKLDSIVSLLTHNRFLINRDHKIYCRLAALVSLRNKLVHKKSFMEEYMFEFHEDEQGIMQMRSPSLSQPKFKDITMGIEAEFGVFEFHDSLLGLKDKFFSVYQKPDFSGNDLILGQEKLFPGPA